MLFRFIVASAVLCLYGAVKKIGLPDKRDIPMILLSGLVGVFCYMWLFNTGTSMVKSGIAGFIIASSPVFTLLLSVLFLKEKSTPRMWAGVLISLVGLGIIAYSQVEGVSLNFGTLLLLGAAVSTSVYNITQRSLLKKYKPIQAITYCLVSATVLMLVFIPKLAAELPNAPLSANLVILYLGVFPAALAYLLWSVALSKAEKTVHATVFLYLSPFMTLVFSYIFLGEVIPLLAFAGGLVIVLGMVLSSLKKRA